MSTAAPEKLMTVEEFLALPEDETKERMLIRGRLWEKPKTRRNRWHSETEAQIVYLLKAWVHAQQKPRGSVYSGEAGVLLRRNPDTTVGIDVCYVAPEIAEKNATDTTLIDGPPVLAVEILSPSDKIDEINSKIDEYLTCGVKLAWVVDPHFKTVVVHRPDAPPEMVSGDDDLTAEPHLPGFQVKASQIFSR